MSGPQPLSPGVTALRLLYVGRGLTGPDTASMNPEYVRGVAELTAQSLALVPDDRRELVIRVLTCHPDDLLSAASDVIDALPKEE